MRVSSITKNAGKACNNRLYRHIRTFEKIIKNYFVIFKKKYTSEIDTTVLTTYLCMICAVIYFVYAMIRGEFTVPDSFEIVLNIMILAVCSTVVGFFCFMKAILLLPVGQVSILSLLEPIFTIIIAFLFLDVKLTVMQCAGTCIVLIAIYIYERK